LVARRGLCLDHLSINLSTRAHVSGWRHVLQDGASAAREPSLMPTSTAIGSDSKARPER
jgi:hypothetical protein